MDPCCAAASKGGLKAMPGARCTHCYPHCVLMSQSHTLLKNPRLSFEGAEEKKMVRSRTNGVQINIWNDRVKLILTTRRTGIGPQYSRPTALILQDCNPQRDGSWAVVAIRVPTSGGNVPQRYLHESESIAPEKPLL